MKRKSIIAVLALVLVLALSLSIFSACNKKHKYSSEWKFDDKTHWHECTTKKHTDTTEKIPHVFTWTEKTPAGVHTDKVEKGVCECGYETERTIPDTATHAYGTEWKKDETGHWHESTCDATAPTHDVMKSDFAAHTFDEGTVTKPADYGVVGEKKFTCTVCEYSYTQDIDALDAKDNAISFANDLVDEKTYDGLAFIIDPAKVNRKGDGEITITYKGENDTAFSKTAPINAGEYTVKATVAATAEWKGGEIFTTITINKREITLPAGVFERKFGENLESGKFGLACINVAADTNNVVEWVTIGAPETYYAIGIHAIGATVLTVDNDNFELNKGTYDAVRFTVWNAPDSFYAGIQNVYTFPGSSDVMINTKIANGTVKKGDQILVNEIGKIIKVNKIKKGTGSSAPEVETATAGEEVGLYIDGATKAELKGGYMLSKPDTIIGYSKVTVTIRVRTEDEGGQHTPIRTGITPYVVFADTFGEVIGKVTFPEGTTLLSGGEMLEGVTIDFQGKKVPAFVGRRFTLRSSGRTIVECIVTAVPQATSVNCTVSAPTGKTAVIEPIQSGENTFMLNLNRSSAFENLVDSEAIDLVVKYNGVIVGSYKRTGLGVGEGDLAHVENGGTLSGSYININLAKSVAGLTDADGKWICDKANVTFDVSATLTEQLDNLGAGSVGTVTLGADEVKYFTLNELENLPSGWYSFVNALYTSGSIYNINHYSVYTDAGTKVDMMSDMFKSDGGKYYVKYTTRKALTDESVGFKAAKAELTAENSTTKLDMPKGKKGDRIVITVTLRKATNYFQENKVQLSANVSAINGAYIKVYNEDYSQMQHVGYQNLTKPTFRLPGKNAEDTLVYIMIEYVADLTTDLSLSFTNRVSAEELNVKPKSGVDYPFKTATFSSKGSEKNFFFNITNAGKYKIYIVKETTPELVPNGNFGAKIFDKNFNTVSVSSTLEFTASSAGTYYLTLENQLTESQTVRICIVQVS